MDGLGCLGSNWSWLEKGLKHDFFSFVGYTQGNGHSLFNRIAWHGEALGFGGALGLC